VRQGRTAWTRAEAYGDPSSANRLIHGDNLHALGWLASELEGSFACAYLDPPFNTGRAFREYKDCRAPAEWVAMMHPRLEEVRRLLRDDGAVFVEIDDTMLASLQLLMDKVFGLEARVATVTIVRSASTGHKAINRGPINVTDFLLIYEKAKGAWRYRAQHRVRETRDPAYSTWLVNPTAACERWQFEPLARHVARSMGYGTRAEAAAELGRSELEQRIAAYALEHADHVVRFAQPRFEAVSLAARALIERSRADPSRVYCMQRKGSPDMVLRGGNRLLFLSRKVATVGGEKRILEPLTNVWDDVAFQGIAKEGGVVFSRNKKPERLLERVLAMATDPGDWVVDPFLGSGTTAAVAHKMGRQWIGIEQGEQLWDMCVPRLRRVVDGEDPTGITRVRAWTGGGGFGVYV
jgi:adenine-specific DNA-methyltransferase